MLEYMERSEQSEDKVLIGRVQGREDEVSAHVVKQLNEMEVCDEVLEKMEEKEAVVKMQQRERESDSFLPWERK